MTGDRQGNLKNDEAERMFEAVFKENFKNLYAFAYTIVKDDSTAKEIVQQSFTNLWQKREKLQSTESLIRYLYKSVYHTGLNHLKHLKVKAVYKQRYLQNSERLTTASERLQQKEVEQKIAEVYNELPEKSRLIFQLSRYEGLKYAEIARRLHVSEKAVEKHITKVLKIFRQELKDYLPFIFILWIIQ
ncbi:RNA polymerase sigma-70 factor [Deminuibacter soli]|uniref:RNA polymerase sigma-70 factor n=1 Tax=Deminuibacter soli TaxID=2291815 RepID=A0A3E1NE76_9BACT|nr:RNA polymerase sigma-70 factor [Deminuibacter soli]RFM26177.1 RNA polymerase sigma-70 factor [Deminuibacter soli]